MIDKKTKTDILGYVSATLTTASFVPQVISVWSIQPAPATVVSLRMYEILTAGIVGWLIYGVRSKSWPIAIANGVTLLLALSIIVYKVKYG